MHQYLGSIHCQVFNALINIFHTALLLELLGAVFLIPELLTKLTMPQWARFKLCSSMFMFSAHPCTHSPNIYKDTDTPILFSNFMCICSQTWIWMQSKCSAVVETVLQGKAYRALLWPLRRVAIVGSNYWQECIVQRIMDQVPHPKIFLLFTNFLKD